MEENPVIPPNPGTPLQTPARPLLLTVVCLGSFVYFGILSVIFLLAAFGAGRIAAVFTRYIPEGGLTTSSALMLAGAGFILHGAALAGTVFIWRMKRKGYLLLGASCLVFSGWQLFNPDAAVSFTAIYIGFILLFGIFFPKLK